MTKHPTFKDALKLATQCHKGQTRWDGEDYITHPLAVADKFEDETHKIVAVLHDVVEDTDMTLDKLQDLGYPMKILYALGALTHYTNETYAKYISDILYNDIAVCVKIEDLKHNLSDLKAGSMRDKYELALRILKW